MLFHFGNPVCLWYNLGSFRLRPSCSRRYIKWLPNGNGFMSFDAFANRIPPPTSVSEAAGNWDSIYSQLGTLLPTDYCRFIEAYGTGHLGRFYCVTNPFSSNRYVNLLQRLNMIRKSEANSTFFLDAGYTFYPDPGGLIPFMHDDNGNDYFWRTVGDPDNWPVIQCAHRGSGFTEHAMTMTAFLLAIFDKTIPALASEFPGLDDEVFEVKPVSQ